MMKTPKKGEFDFFDIELVGMGDLANLKLPDPALLAYYQNLDQRTIYWNCTVDEMITEIGNYIRKWNAEDTGAPVEQRMPIRIFINTDGGDLISTMYVVDVIKASKTPVYTIGMGKTYSAGGLLLMAGHKRFIFENTSCLIHDGQTGAYGSTGKVLDNAKFTEEMEARQKKYILGQTKITPEQYDQQYRRDWFMFAEDMVKYGIADKIIHDLSEIEI